MAGDLRPAHIEEAIAKWNREATVARTERLLSTRTIRHLYDTLRMALRWSVSMGILARNPADAVKPPKVERSEMHTLEPDDIARLLQAARGTELLSAIAVAVATGLRRGELLGLRWPDIDFDGGKLAVRRSIEFVKGRDDGRYTRREKPPKPAKSARTLSLPPSVMAVLRSQRADQLSRLLLLGLGRDDNGYVFDRADGTPWNPDSSPGRLRS